MSQTSRSADAAPSQTSSTSIAPTALHTPASLVAKHGTAQRVTILGFLLGLDDAGTVSLGEGIAPSRIVTDGTRLLGEATDFLSTANDDQRALLSPPVTDEFLCAAATCVATIDTLDRTITRRKTRYAATQKAGTSEVERAMLSARARRRLYQKKIVAMAGGDSAWKQRINGACGSATSLTAMADTIDTLASEGRALAKEAAAKGSKAVVPAATFAAMTAYAKQLRETSKTTEGVASKLGVRKGELGWWCGAGVWFLQTLVEMFNAAHGVDVMVPSMTYSSLRSALVAHPTKRKSAAKTPKAPKPPTG